MGLAMMQPGRLHQRIVRRQLLAASILVLGLAGAHAQTNNNAIALPPVSAGPADLPPSQVLPPTPDSGPAARNPAPSNPSSAASAKPCTGDGGAADKGFGCLNEKLKSQVDQANSNASTPNAPIDARSSDLKVGVVNVPAVRQQYGKNFGVSAVPFRPPMVFSPTLGHH
jgi:hypothetical protein